MEAELTHENFAKNLNTEYQVELDGEQIQLVLISISHLKKTEKQEEFSIMFRGPLDHPLPQAIHQFRHANMGDFPLFIVPTSKGDEGYQYQAIFNRLF